MMLKREDWTTTKAVLPHLKDRLLLKGMPTPLATTTSKTSTESWTTPRHRGATKIMLAHPLRNRRSVPPGVDHGSHRTCQIAPRPRLPRVWRICCPFPSPFRPWPHRLIFEIWANPRQPMAWNRSWNNCVWAVARQPRQDSSPYLLPNDWAPGHLEG